MEFLNTHAATSQLSITPSANQGTASLSTSKQGLPEPQGGFTLSPDAATMMLQAAPFMQQAATAFRIGQPKTLATIQQPAHLSKLTALSTAKHYSDLRREQGKLAREGTIKLIAYFFLALKGKEMDAPYQVCCHFYTCTLCFSLTHLKVKAISTIKSFALATPMAEAFQDTFVTVRESIVDLFPSFDSAKLTTFVHS